MTSTNSAATVGSTGCSECHSNTRPRVTKAKTSVTRLTAGLSGTARRTVSPIKPTNTGSRNSAPPKPTRPPSTLMGTAYRKAMKGRAVCLLVWFVA